MAENDELTADILEFLEKVDNMKDSDRKELLIAIIKKHLIVHKSDLMLTYGDFQDMVSYAKKQYSTISFPVMIEGRRLEPNEAANYCMFLGVEAVLNKKEAFKRSPNFRKGK